MKLNSSTKYVFPKRQIMTCVHESSSHAEKYEKANAFLIYNVLQKQYKNHLLFDEVDKEAHKMQPILSRSKDDSGKEIPVLNEITKETQNIMDISVILQSLCRPISIQRI